MKGTDKYLVDVNGTLNKDYSICLSQLYTPIAGMNAVSLYGIMVGEIGAGKVFELNKLLKLSGIDIDSFEAAIESLEKCELLETYIKKEENLYLFVLQSPLSAEAFLNHDVYGHIYLDKVGKKLFDSVKAVLTKKHLEREYFENITHKMDGALTDWNDIDKQVFDYVKYENPNEEKYIFDIKGFVREYGDTVFPKILRTEDNISTIANLGTTFAIGDIEMAKFLKQAIDYKAGTLDVKTLRLKCLASKKIEVADIEDDYQLPPIAFLYKRRETAVADSDKLFLERCQNDFKLKREVINVLIETVLKNNENRFPIKYAGKLASEWSAIKIDTKEKALAEAEMKKDASTASVKKKKVYTLDEMDVEQADIEAIRKQLFKKG